MEDKDNLPLVVGAMVGVLFLAFMIAKRYEATRPATPSVTVPPQELENEPPEPRQPDSLSAPHSPPRYAIQPEIGTRAVYECIRDGQRVFSDSPCGDNTKVRTLNPVNVMDAPSPIYRANSAPTPYVDRTVTTDNTETPARDCTPYEEEVKQIDARMRLGYTSSEGEFWRERRRKASAMRDDCKRDNRLR